MDKVEPVNSKFESEEKPQQEQLPSTSQNPTLINVETMDGTTGEDGNAENQQDNDDFFMLIENIPQNNRLPASLKQLLQALFGLNKNVLPVDVLVAMIYYLSFENGFVPNTFPIESSSAIATYWGYSFVAQIPKISSKLAAKQIFEQSNLHTEDAHKFEGTYTFIVKLLDFSDREVQLIIRKVFNGEALCVTFCIDKEQQAESTCLRVADYISIKEMDFDEISNNPIGIFHNINLLVEKMKCGLITPIRNQLMFNNEPNHPYAALIGMPKDMLWLLFSFLRNDLKTMHTLSQTCTYLREVAIAYLDEKNVRLHNRRSTPIIRDPHYRPYNLLRWPRYI